MAPEKDGACSVVDAGGGVGGVLVGFLPFFFLFGGMFSLSPSSPPCTLCFRCFVFFLASFCREEKQEGAKKTRNAFNRDKQGKRANTNRKPTTHQRSHPACFPLIFGSFRSRNQLQTLWNGNFGKNLFFAKRIAQKMLHVCWQQKNSAKFPGFISNTNNSFRLFWDMPATDVYKS